MIKTPKRGAGLLMYRKSLDSIEGFLLHARLFRIILSAYIPDWKALDLSKRKKAGRSASSTPSPFLPPHGAYFVRNAPLNTASLIQNS
jgi:hypothetical protein